MLQKHIPHQCVMNTQQYVNPSPSQMVQYQNPGPIHLGNTTNHNILLTTEEEILLQTRDRQYSVPPKNTPTTSKESIATSRQPLMIPHPKIENPIRIPRISL
jgi:hypothetical protein